MDSDESRDVAAYFNALDQLAPLTGGLWALSALQGALEAGLVGALRQPRTLSEIAEITGIGRRRAELICQALEGQDIAVREGDRYVLDDAWLPLAAPTALQSLGDSLDQAFAFAQGIREAANGRESYWSMSEVDRLNFAKGASGIDPLSPLAAFAMAGQFAFVPTLNEWHAVFQAGGRHLELGCGVAATVFALLRTYPTVTVLGVDIAPDLLEEARKRADRLGVSDRVEFRCQDARYLPEESEFDTAFWSQFFFTEDARGEALRVLYRAMKPGGLMVAPIFSEPAADQSVWARRRYLLAQVLYDGWGAPLLTPDEVRTEIEEAGFEVLSVTSRPRGGHSLMARRPRSQIFNQPDRPIQA